MLRIRFLTSVSIVLLLLSGCGLDTKQPESPTAAEAGGDFGGSASVSASSSHSPTGVERPARGWDAATLFSSSEYELIFLRRDGWDVHGQFGTPFGVRDVSYSIRIDGERCLYTGEVRDGSRLLWRQSFEAAVDGSVVQVEETDGFDLLRIEVLAGDRENYTLLMGDGEVRRYSAPVGAEDPKGWEEFWPSTGLDWNPDAALCNGLVKGRILREEFDAALRSSASIGDPQYLHPLLEQVCNLLKMCTIVKCRMGGNANQICLDCQTAVAGCDLLRLIFD